MEDATGQSTSDRLAESVDRITGRAPTADHRGIRPEDQQNPCAFPVGTPERGGVPDSVCDREEVQARDFVPAIGMAQDFVERLRGGVS